MESQYSWKRTEDTEIDLTDLLYRLCVQWKRIAVCALAFALVFGGAGWLKSRGAISESEFITEEETTLTESEEQAVEDAVRLNREISGLEEYLDNSVLMQLDSYHRVRYVMLYSIKCEEKMELPGIVESYLNFVSNGGAADALKEQDSRWDMDKSYLSELLYAYQKTYNLPYQIVIGSQSEMEKAGETFFYVEITGKNASEAKRMASDMKDILEAFHLEVEKMAGSHRLVLAGSAESEKADGTLQTLQHDKRTLLSSSKSNLNTIVGAFSKEQESVYTLMSGKKQGEESGEDLSKEMSGSVFKTGMKYAVLGFMGGIFIYGCVYLCSYLFCDTVKSLQEMKRMYTFPVYGGMVLENEKNRKIAGAWRDAFGQTGIQVLSRVRIACQKLGITEFCAASDFLLQQLEMDCLDSMSVCLKEWNMEMTVAENINTDTGAWDRLIETGSVLMICRIGTTTHQMIDDAMQFYLQNGITVAGAVVFL